MRRFLSFLIPLLVCLGNARADVTSTFDFAEWQLTVDKFATIDFVGFPDNTPISNQYADLGVMFTGPAFISGPTPGFVNDSWGLHGPVGVHIFFDQPQSWIAIHHGGNAYFDLYSDGELIGTSDFDPVGGIGSFLGVVSSMPFDEVIITKPAIFGMHIYVDDLHWGGATPVAGDANGDGLVNIDDLFAVVAAWGRCPSRGTCSEDFDADGDVEIDDLFLVIANWT